MYRRHHALLTITALQILLFAVRTDALTAVLAAVLGTAVLTTAVLAAAAFTTVLFAVQPLALTAGLIAALLMLTVICTTALEARAFTIQMPVDCCQSDLHPTYRTGHQLNKKQ
jgi:hypothetical protein